MKFRSILEKKFNKTIYEMKLSLQAKRNDGNQGNSCPFHFQPLRKPNNKF